MRSTAAVALAGLVSLGACARPDSTLTAPVYEAAHSFAATGRNDGVPLSGREEVPARPTRARGTAIFRVSDDGQSIDYRLIVANIENVVQAHIHLGAAGTNGPVVTFLFGPVPPAGGRVDGVLATGTITATNLIGPLAGQPLSALLDGMRVGNHYVNVHTDDGDTSPTSGPGDFPGGEVRGQIR